MQLLPDWWSTLKRAWSVRWWAASIIFTGLEAALPAVQEMIDMPRGIFAAVAGVVGSIGILSRLLAQPETEKTDGE